MPNRETWDWAGLEPNQPVTMTLLWDRNATIIKDGVGVEIKDDGETEKEGKVFDWHRYPVRVEGQDWTMFTPCEEMHQALQTLNVDKKGNLFQVTKKIDGWNKETKKSYTYYELERDGTKFRTDQINGKPPTTPQGQVEKAVKDTVKATDLKELHARAFNAVMDNILDYHQEWCPDIFENRETPEGQKKIAQLISSIIPHIGSMVNTLVIQNGGLK